MVYSVNVVSFCQSALEGEHLGVSPPSFPEGLNTTFLEEQLQQQNYVYILLALWGEKDYVRRLKWLDAHVELLHPPLLFEYALTQLVVNPSTENVVRVALPFFRGAIFCTKMDIACALSSPGHPLHIFDASPAESLEMTYGTRMMQAARRVGLDLEGIGKLWHKELKKSSMDFLKSVAERVLRNPASLPDPTWLGVGSSLQFGARETFAEIRQKFVHAGDQK